MTTSIEQPPAGIPDATAARAADHLWMHFARQGRHPDTPVPVITRGEGAYIWDNQGRKVLDGLSGLFVVQVAPPLICGQPEFDEIEQVLRQTLVQAQDLL